METPELKSKNLKWKINKFIWIWKKSKCLLALKKVIIQRSARKSHFKDSFNKATLVNIKADEYMDLYV